jgi:hypothetical protein
MINNKCGWVDWFQRTNQSLSGLLGINEKTLISARNTLKQLGLIDFVAGTKRTSSTRYQIIKLYVEGEENTSRENLQPPQLGVNFTPNVTPQYTSNITPKTTPQPTDLYKHKLKHKKDKEIDKENKTQFAEFVAMTNAEYEKLLSTYGEEKVKHMVEILDNYKGSNGKSYKSDYRAILNWVAEKVIKEWPQDGAYRSKNVNEFDFSGMR